MSTVRLTFLYPHLFRSIRTCEPVVHCVRSHQTQKRQRLGQPRGIATTDGRRQRFVKRHGKAVESSSPGGEIAEELKVFAPEQSSKHVDQDKQTETAVQENDSKSQEEETIDEVGRRGSGPLSTAPLFEEVQPAAKLPGDDDAVAGGRIAQDTLQAIAANPSGSQAPLETVLQMPPPETVEEKNAARPPHLQTPPYVHHFDTYTLVQQVEAGGFTTDQSVTAMKAVRSLLAINLDVAKAGLVSKSDVENETYLFRAACSELKTEIQNSRKKKEEIMRRDRTLLQHEVDILNQKLAQELLTLKDDLKGMFDDRKMAVRMEQRAMESKIQELNYEITVKLNSDSKSEVEGLRWVLTRRSVMGILIMAFMVLTSLRYASYKSHENEMKRKKKEAAVNPEVGEELLTQGAAEILAAN